ncbi:hypothetical protein SCNU_11261 [Gordonia neofelifaecis NRRL B-59395]|uniref:Bacterial Ig-like domain-containing protein n=2 Tax=Gordonia TaxID=2053 RepID=F1YK22_9ACTN|nr:hypothetical protein SCNU_11261 [Gordonia neofelifaecis NRRL B-59395]
MAVSAPASAETSTPNFKNSCIAGSVIGDQKRITQTTMTVDAPAQVAPGETFTYRIQPSASSYPDKDSGATTTNLSRIKFDYEMLDNATFVGATVVPGTGIGLSGAAPSVLRVNIDGNPDTNGSVLRLSGNNETIGNGPNSNAKAEGGIVVAKSKKNLDGSANSANDTWFQLPAIEVTLTAGGNGAIQPKLRTSGAAGNQGDMGNYNTQLARATVAVLGTQWAPTRCSPRDSDGGPLNSGAGPLATIQVGNGSPVDEDKDTTTTLSVPGTATTGDEVTLTATVAPAPTGGKVQFKADGANLGGPVDVEDGKAVLKHTFATAGDREITAVFSGTDGFTGSTSAAQTIKVSAPAPTDKDTTISVDVPDKAKTGAEVTLTANLTPSDVDGGTVQFSVDGVAVGGPVTVVNGKAVLKHTFTTDGKRTVTAVYNGTDGFKGSISAPAFVDVSTDNPGGGDGGGDNGGDGGDDGGDSNGSLGTGSLGDLGLVASLTHGLF